MALVTCKQYLTSDTERQNMIAYWMSGYVQAPPGRTPTFRHSSALTSAGLAQEAEGAGATKKPLERILHGAYAFFVPPLVVYAEPSVLTSPAALLRVELGSGRRRRSNLFGLTTLRQLGDVGRDPSRFILESSVMCSSA